MYVYKLEIDINNDIFILKIFEILEKEVRFPRGCLYVKDGKIVAEAADASSLRSLVHTIFRAMYIAESVAVFR